TKPAPEIPAGGVTELTMAPARRRRTRLPGPLWLHQAVLVVVLLVAWELSSGRLVDAVFISSPTAVAERMYELFSSGSIYEDIRVTYTEFLLGYLLAAVVGISLGALLGKTEYLARLFDP